MVETWETFNVQRVGLDIVSCRGPFPVEGFVGLFESKGNRPRRIAVVGASDNNAVIGLREYSLVDFDGEVAG